MSVFLRTSKALQKPLSFGTRMTWANTGGETREARFEVDLQHRVFLTALEPELAKRLVACARKQGVSTETLINVWLSEKLTTASKSR